MERALVLNKCGTACRRQAHAQNERTERKIERSNCNAKGSNEKPAARSKADAAEPLGISLYLSRGGNGFFVGCTFALMQISVRITSERVWLFLLRFRCCSRSLSSFAL